jgi:hypothetical protein
MVHPFLQFADFSGGAPQQLDRNEAEEECGSRVSGVLIDEFGVCAKPKVPA